MKLQSKLLWALPGVALWGCEPGNPEKSVGQQVETPDGTGEDGAVDLDVPLKITADYPAFYNENGVVMVHGRIEDGSIGEIQTLTVDGQPATLLDGMRFEGEVVLGNSEPWRVVELFVKDDNNREGRIQVQVAWAEATTDGVRSDGLGVLAGPEALDQLARHVQTFVRPEELAPPEGAILRRTCEPINEPDVESGDITEELRLTGTATVRAIRADVFTDDEALHLDLQGTEIVWGAEVVSTLDAETFVRPAELVLELRYGDDLPHSPCDALWVPVTRVVEPVEWGAEFTWPPSCFDAEAAGEAALPLYRGLVPPELDRASCAWAEWLDTALATELSGVSVERAVAVDRAGLALAHTTEPNITPPVKMAGTPIELGGDTLSSTVDPAVLGPVLHAAAALDLHALGEDTLAGEPVTWTRTAPAPEVTTLVADDGGAMGVLPSPVGFRVEVGSGACAVSGHVIPAPVALAVEDQPEGVFLSAPAEVAGVDVVNACGLSDSQWSTVLSSVVESAYNGQAATWRPTDGLMLLGGTPDTTVDARAVRTEVSVPEP